MQVVLAAVPIVVLAAAAQMALAEMPQRRMLALAVLVRRVILQELTFGMLAAAAVHSSVLQSRVQVLARLAVKAAAVVVQVLKIVWQNRQRTALTVSAAAVVAACRTRVR